MNRVAIVTDSTADLPQSLREELNIYTIPLKIQIGSNTYRDVIDFSAEEFYRKVKDGCLDLDSLQPSPSEFMEMYKEILDKHSAIISIHLSSKVSGTVSSAAIAKTMLGEEFDITVIDSKFLSMALGVIVLEVARAGKEGRSKDELINQVQQLQNSIHGYLLTEGNCVFDFFLKPQPEDQEVYNIFKFNQNEFNLLEGHRNKSKALQEFVAFLCSQLDKDIKHKIAIIHCDNLEDAIKLQDSIEGSIIYDEMIISETSSVVASKIGLGAVGIILYPA